MPEMSTEERQTTNETRICASLLVLALAAATVALQPAARAQSAAERWVGTWGTALVGRPQTPPPPFMRNACPAPPAPATPPPAPPAGVTFAPQPFVHFTNQTLRQIVRTSVGGSRLRVVLSNAYGTSPLTVGAAHVALRDKEDA